MGEILIGTASWTDKSLVQSGWYPKDASSADARLRFYTTQFPLVEVDSSYYFLPSDKNSRLWAERSPAGFTFNIKAFSLLTQHPTKPPGPQGLCRGATSRGKKNIYIADVEEGVRDAVWEASLEGLEPLRGGGQARAPTVQFPQWFTVGSKSRDYIIECAARAAPDRICIEFRNKTWMSERNRERTLEFLEGHGLPYVCVDMPQGFVGRFPDRRGHGRHRSRALPRAQLGRLGERFGAAAFQVPLLRGRARRMGAAPGGVGRTDRKHPRAHEQLLSRLRSAERSRPCRGAEGSGGRDRYAAMKSATYSLQIGLWPAFRTKVRGSERVNLSSDGSIHAYGSRHGHPQRPPPGHKRRACHQGQASRRRGGRHRPVRRRTPAGGGHPRHGQDHAGPLLARSLSGSFKRVQATPDLLPSDITGSSIFNQRRLLLRVHPRPDLRQCGPARRDQPDHSPYSVGTARSDGEHAVTVDGIRHVLPEPLFVIATQNPLEQHGTYPLPEGQLRPLFHRHGAGLRRRRL